MAKILKCPRCRQSMDVTCDCGGSTVRCPDCGQMARVPTGGTSVAVKTVSAPIPASQAAPAARERGTRIRERNRSSGTIPVPPPQKSSQGGLFIGLGIGAVAVIAVIVFFTMKSHEELPAPPKATGPKETGTVTFAPKLPPSSDKPIVLGSGDKGDVKPTQISKPSENVDNVNWDALMRDLRPGGGFEHEDRPEGVAYKKVKSFGKAAYPKLIGYIDAEEPAVAVAAVAVLNSLTGRDSAYPKGVNKSKIKAEWEEWLKSADASKPDAPK